MQFKLDAFLIMLNFSATTYIREIRAAQFNLNYVKNAEFLSANANLNDISKFQNNARIVGIG